MQIFLCLASPGVGEMSVSIEEDAGTCQPCRGALKEESQAVGLSGRQCCVHTMCKTAGPDN